MSKPLKIDVLANDGSPLGVTEQSIDGLDGRLGVGGAELAILTLCRGWHDAGHDVTFYNNPTVAKGSVFRQSPISFFNPSEERDILIVFRSPNERAKAAKGKKIWFSTDQYTVGDFAEFAKHVDKIVTISPFHAEHFKDTYEINNTITIDLPVRVWEYNKEVQKTKNSLIFCSVPDRGLSILAGVYGQLKSAVPSLTLAITSDYRLWGVDSPRNEQYIRKFLGKDGVRFLGAIPRQQMINEQLAAEVHAYSCLYPELFCYASAECQVAGAYPISSSVGALATTNMGVLVNGNVHSLAWKDEFVSQILIALENDKERKELAEHVKQRARERFSLERILGEWEKIFHE